MKRKVMQTGRQASIVSLPVEWVKEYQVSKGDELELELEGNRVIYSTEKKRPLGRISIDATPIYHNLIWRFLRQLYISGYDEIEVKFNDIQLIQKVSKTLIGMGIINQSGNTCIIKDLAGVSEVKFETIVKRVFSLVQNNVVQFEEAVENGKPLEFVRINDFVINEFSDYCLRTLSKTGYGSFHKTILYYNMVKEMENIGDVYKRLANFEEKELKKKLDKIKMTSNTLTLFNEVISKYSEEKAIKISDAVKTIQETCKANEGKVERELNEVAENLMNLTTIAFEISITH